MHVLKARFRSKKAFLDVYDADLPGGGFFCPTTRRLERDDEVLVQIHFPGLPNKTILRATVMDWRPALPRLGVRAGATLAFGESEEETRDFLLAVAAGERVDAVKRRHTRLPVGMDVRWRHSSSADFTAARLRDISIGGAQLVTEDVIEVDSSLILELIVPGGAQAIPLAAKVSNRGDGWYGITFVYRDGGGSRRLREVVRRLLTAGVA